MTGIIFAPAADNSFVYFERNLGNDVVLRSSHPFIPKIFSFHVVNNYHLCKAPGFEYFFLDKLHLCSHTFSDSLPVVVSKVIFISSSACIRNLFDGLHGNFSHYFC